jgi:hypothetical protein
MKNPILRDQEAQQVLDEKGFVKVSLFSEQHMQPLIDCFVKYESYHFIQDGGFHHTTHHTNDWELIAEVSRELIALLRERIDELFTRYAILGANFILKDFGQHTEFVPHQDWTLVDETKYHSVNLWLPLHDLTGNNGMLRFLPGSMHILRNLRMPPHYPELFGQVMHLIYPYMETVPLRLGEAVVFDCCVLHGSFANTSGTYRKNIIMGLFSQDAGLRFHYNTQQGQPNLVEEYHISPEEFLTFAVGQRPNGRRPDRIFPYRFPVITEQEFFAHYPRVTSKEAP